ncbi:MAG: sugar transferase, partial [Desulfobulbaceae bacterium]|nr:sugar transferase [Desulfobulbaceae bacterium]
MPYIFKKYYPVRNIFFFFGEGLLIFLAISGVYWFFLGGTEYFEGIPLYTLQAMLVTFIFQICLYYFDLYDLSITNSFADTAARITQAFGVGCISLAIIYYLAPETTISTEIFFTGYLVICGSIAVWRFFYALVLDRRMFAQPILILGTGVIAENIANEIENKRDSAYKIVAYAGDGKPRVNPQRVPVVHDKREIFSVASARKAEKIIVALDDKRGNTPTKELLACKLRGMSIVQGIEFYESLAGKILVEKVNPTWIVFSEGFKQGRGVQIIKRAVDILLASFGLLISLPIILVTSVIIKLESPGPVLYTQDRVGEKGTIFKVIKFR